MHARLGATITALVLLASPTSALAQNLLRQDQSLAQDQQVRSLNGRYHLIMQSDCNLVLYEGARALWASNTHGRGSGCRAVMQGDGNLVVYSPAGDPLWASNTAGRANATLQLEDSGDLAIYSGGRAVWRTNTAQAAPDPGRPGGPGGPGRPGQPGPSDSLSPGQSLRADQQVRSSNRRYHLIMQSDCNLVVYEGTRPIWASGTHGRGSSCRADMQEDGNLVVYDLAGRPLWASGTHGRRGARLRLRDDGVLELTQNGSVIWSSGSDGRDPGQPGDRDRPWSGADTLRAGDELRADREEFIGSARGDHRLTLRRSCEIEITTVSGWSPRPSWTSGTAYAGRNCRLVLRSTGELLLIADGRTVWGTGTSGRDVLAYVSRDGDLVLYDRDRGRELFNSRRDRGRRY